MPGSRVPSAVEPITYDERLAHDHRLEAGFTPLRFLPDIEQLVAVLGCSLEEADALVQGDSSIEAPDLVILADELGLPLSSLTRAFSSVDKPSLGN